MDRRRQNKTEKETQTPVAMFVRTLCKSGVKRGPWMPAADDRPSNVWTTSVRFLWRRKADHVRLFSQQPWFGGRFAFEECRKESTDRHWEKHPGSGWCFLVYFWVCSSFFFFFFVVVESETFCVGNVPNSTCRFHQMKFLASFTSCLNAWTHLEHVKMTCRLIRGL